VRHELPGANHQKCEPDKPQRTSRKRVSVYRGYDRDHDAKEFKREKKGHDHLHVADCTAPALRHHSFGKEPNYPAHFGCVGPKG
jgi:hypothetical protein